MNIETRTFYRNAAIQYYCTGYRPYHNYTHASKVAELCATINGTSSDVLWLAGLFHDAVYIPGDDENEERSALALSDAAANAAFLGFSVDLMEVGIAMWMIRNTTVAIHLNQYRAINPELAILLDADLYALADTSFDSFVHSQKNILAENYLDPEDPNNLKKSAKFLIQFLDCREYIYHTEYCRNMFEKTARTNIGRLWAQTCI